MKVAPYDLKEITAFRESLYHFFSESLLRPPDDRALAVWRDAEWRSALLRLLDLPSVSLPSDSELGSGKELAAEHARLFHVPATQTCPFESYHRATQHSDSGHLRANRTAEVLQVYRSWGLRPELLTEEVPDHAATQLLFMGKLISLESQLRAEGDDRQLTSALRAQKSFLDEHILVWFPAWITEVKKRAPHPFYRSVAQLLARFLEVDRNTLGLLLEVRV